MKTGTTVLIAVLLAGCAHRPHSQFMTDGTLTEGESRIAMPNIMTNRPVFAIENCGIIGFEAVPFEEQTRWHVGMHWPLGRAFVAIETPAGRQLADFSIWCDGTNVFLSLGEPAWSKPEYKVVPHEDRPPTLERLTE